MGVSEALVDETKGVAQAYKPEQEANTIEVEKRVDVLFVNGGSLDSLGRVNSLPSREAILLTLERLSC